MNIFYVSHPPANCARQHPDKHVVKMILEYSQLLSTTHRILDGTQYAGKTATGRNVKRWRLDHEVRDHVMYAATHINHPSCVWVRQSNSNYEWLHQLLVELCREYTYRYGKIHKCERIGLVDLLSTPPVNIPLGEFTAPTPAMPDECKVLNDSMASYRNYYNNFKTHLGLLEETTRTTLVIKPGVSYANV